MDLSRHILGHCYSWQGTYRNMVSVYSIRNDEEVMVPRVNNVPHNQEALAGSSMLQRE